MPIRLFSGRFRNPKSKITNPKSVFFSFQSRDLAEDGAEEGIVVLDAVVEVDVDLAGGDFEEYFFIVFEFLELLLDGGDFFDGLRLYGLGFAGAVSNHLAMLGVVGEFVAEVAKVLQHGADRFGAIAMHVDQGVEGSLGTAEQPVDRSLLVGLEVVLVEVVKKILSKRFTERRFDEVDVLFEVFGSKRGLEKLLKSIGHIIFEPFTFEDGYHTIRIRHKAHSVNLQSKIQNR